MANGNGKDKGKAARALFDGACDLLVACGKEDGARLRRAVDGVGEVIGANGFQRLRDGDVVGGIAEAVLNARKLRGPGNAAPGGRKKTPWEKHLEKEGERKAGGEKTRAASSWWARFIAAPVAKARAMVQALSREERLEYLLWNDPDGVYTDEANRREYGASAEPVSSVEATKLMMDVWEDSQTSEDLDAF